MEEAGQTGLASARSCNCKTISKFALLYFTSLSIVVLIFTALNQETLNGDQSTWWWAFLFSLVITSSTTATTLGVVLYFEACYIVLDDYDQTTGGKSSGSPMQQDADITANSASFKTVLTINSALPTTRDGITVETEQTKAAPENSRKAPTYTNLTENPSLMAGIQSFAFKGPVTVVDMRKNAKDRSLAPIPPPIVNESSFVEPERKSKSLKTKNKKVKKTKKQ